MSIRMAKIDYDVVALAGGLDLITPSLSLKPGVVRDSLNFEVSATGGYTRIAGYERYDGRASPSAASYQIQQLVSFTNTPTVGQTLTGNTSAATGIIIAIGSNYLVLTRVTGTFSSTEVVKVGATTIGTSTTLSTSVTSKVNAQYLALAADSYRALIGAVPGSGAIRGVAALTVSGVDKVFAWRDNAGATGCDLYVASTSGWTKINYKHEISFTAGGGAVLPVDGATLTQGGNTATIRRIMDSSGGTPGAAWAGAVVGRFVIDAPAPGNFIAGAATISGGATCTLSGPNTAITVLPGGRYETVTGNFTASKGTVRLYGCDGVNRGFEFDGTTFAPISTGATTDTPKHCVIHKNQMIWAIATSNIMSGPGLPYRYTATDGGGEIGVGDTITGYMVQPGAQTTAAMAIYTRSNTFMLYGTGLSSWNLVPYNTGSGATDYTVQNMSQSYALDYQFGITSLSTTLAYGNFAQASITNNIKPFIADKRAKVVSSSLMRDRSQYRLFFNDGYGLYVTIVNGKMLGAMPVYFPNILSCTWEGDLSSGEATYAGSASGGFVYQLDVGSSFDGASLDAYFTLAWNSMRSPRVLKQMRRASVEMQGSYYAEISYGYQLGYGSSEVAQPTPAVYTSGFSAPPAWDVFTWDSFTWDGRTIFPTEVDLTGTAENIQVTISCTGNYIYPFTVNSVINHYTPRRGLR